MEHSDNEDTILCPYCYEGPTTKTDAYPMTQDTYNRVQCDDPNCGCPHLNIACSKHPLAGMYAQYCKKHGTLTLVCVGCMESLSCTYVSDNLSVEPADREPFLYQPVTNWKPRDPRTNHTHRGRHEKTR